jgi:fibro-slime domain-containing protein/LPXTG-motif cell wall-anchored protein
MKIKGKIAFGTALVMAIALISMGVVKESGTKSKADSTIDYFTANFFDYEASDASFDKIDTDKVLFGRQNGGQANSEHNTWRDETKYKVVQGLAADTIGEKFALKNKVAKNGKENVNLFDKDDAKTFKGAHMFPFVKSEKGYYTYDSDANHVEITSDGENMKRYDGKSQYGFMPLNKVDGSKNSDGYVVKNPNYYFGMSMAIKFYMPESGKIKVDGQNEDMKFDFSGDDDMWVYVDGKLVLDLGGVHTAVDGSINFATGQVSTTGNHIANVCKNQYSTNKETKNTINQYIKGLSAGEHTLRVYYLERGASVSKCKIMFRLADPKPAETPAPTETPEEKADPTPEVKPEQTPAPTVKPTVAPTVAPTVEPTKEVTVAPTEAPKEEKVEPAQEEVVEPSELPKSDEKVQVEEKTYEKEPAIEKEPVVEKEDKSPAVVKAVKKILPQTGTLEEYIFYVIGGLLVVGGVSLLILQNKKIKKSR